MGDGRDEPDEGAGGTESDDSGPGQPDHGDDSPDPGWGQGARDDESGRAGEDESAVSGAPRGEVVPEFSTNGTDPGGGRDRTDPSAYVTDERSLSSRIQAPWAIRVGIAALIVGLIAAFTLASLDRNPRFGALVVGVAMTLGGVWVVLYYRRWVYQIRTDAIYLERGVFTHVRTLVPYVRIQHVDTSRGPVERLLGLSTLVVYTAGSRGADVSIPGLTPEEASDLQQRVKQLAIEAEGDDAL